MTRKKIRGIKEELESGVRLICITGKEWINTKEDDGKRNGGMDQYRRRRC